MSSEPVRSVAGLWRFPVKSMKGEAIEQAEVTSRGLVGDRLNVIVDTKEEGVVENDWVNHWLTLGKCVRLRVAAPVAKEQEIDAASTSAFSELSVQ